MDRVKTRKLNFNAEMPKSPGIHLKYFDLNYRLGKENRKHKCESEWEKNKFGDDACAGIFLKLKWQSGFQIHV